VHLPSFQARFSFQAAKETTRLPLSPTTPLFLLTTTEAAGAFEGEEEGGGGEEGAAAEGAGMVIVLKTIVGLAVVVDVAVVVISAALGEVAEGCCCWALGVVTAEVALTEAEAEVEAVADAVVLEYNGAVLLASLLAGCVGWAAAGLPPSLYLGIGGRAMEVLNPAGREVCSVSEAGGEDVVADVKVHSCLVMIVGVGAWAVRD